MKLVGLDFEGSGSDPWGDHVPIQIGVAIGDDFRIKYNIGGWNWKQYEWDEEAFEVHGITQEELMVAEPVWKVDVRLAADLFDVVGSRMWNVPVGFNVAGYDRQFITRWMPNVNRLLSYRSIDLGALCFVIGGDENGYDKVKRNAKQYAMEQMGIGVDEWHDALVDAEGALHMYDFLSDIITKRT